MTSVSELLAKARAHEKAAEATKDPSEEVTEYRAARQLLLDAAAREDGKTDPSVLYHAARIQMICLSLDDSDDEAGDSDDGDDNSDNDDNDLEAAEHRLAVQSDSIARMRRALELRPDYGECLFALAEALIARADESVELAEMRFRMADDVFGIDDEDDDDDGNEHHAANAEREAQLSRAREAVKSARDAAKADLVEACEIFDKVYALFEKQLGSKSEDGEDVTERTLTNTLVGHTEALSTRAYLADDADTFEPLFDQAIAKLQKAIEVEPKRKSELLQEWASVLEARADKRAAGHDEKDGEILRTRDNMPDYQPALAKLDEAIAADEKNHAAWMDRADLLMTSADQELIVAVSSSQSRPADDIDDDAADLEYPDDVQKRVWQLNMDAKDAIEKAASLDPKSDLYAMKAGDLCFAMARLEMPIARPHKKELDAEAESWYRKAIEIDQEEPALVARLAQVIFFAQGGADGGMARDAEVQKLLTKYKEEMDGTLDDLMDEDDIFEQEFIARASQLFPEVWSDTDSEEDDDE